jgi:NAD(P)H-dependent nitrite reductase small subunit
MIADRTWTRVTATDNVPLREGRLVNLGGREIALFNLGGRYAAVDNECPHQGGPLCDGIVSGTAVVCPLHGWKFDLDTGGPVRASLPNCLTTYPTRVEDGFILVDVAGGSRIDDDEVAA